MRSIKKNSALLSLTMFLTVVRASELDVREPDKAESPAPRKSERSRWAWNDPHAVITPTGDLTLKQLPFKFEAGDSVIYIDFEAGNDDNSGAEKTAAWKHHPWDPSAIGKAQACTGVHTYVFKRGVVYRGEMVATESGDARNPIRLTSDPSWGEGEAVISGSERVTGWTKGATNKNIPDGEKVWRADVAFLPRNVFQIVNAKVERLNLARIPNWKESDPEDVMSEWWTWEQPQWWTNQNVTRINGHEAFLGIDKVHLTQPADYYLGAIVRTEYGYVMGTPFPTPVESFDAARHAVAFQGIWSGASEHLMTNHRYFLEDKPQYLDEPGEFWFERKGEGGTLYLRLKDDGDPNQAVVEAARHINLIQDKPAFDSPPRLDILGPQGRDNLNVAGIGHLAITGLTFRCTNTFWDIGDLAWMHKDVDNACIRLLGSTDDVRVSNCRFEQVAKAIQITALNPHVRTDHIVIADNDMRFLDHGAINIAESSDANDKNTSFLGDVKILRNNLFMIGTRAFRGDHSHAIYVATPVTIEVAGNIMDRLYGAGIYVMRGKGINGAPQSLREIRLGRALIHNNSVTNSLLCADDWGGIEVNGGGPAYVYNNVSGNPNGVWNASYNPKRPVSGRLGMAYYLDSGGSKTYLFNNVAWGISSDVTDRHCNACVFYESGRNIFNEFFNNTIYDFGMGSNWSPAGGRWMSLGNLWMNIGSWVYLHRKVKEDRDRLPAGEFPLFGDAYGKNVFFGISKEFSIFESNGVEHDTVESMSQALAKKKSLCANVGSVAPDSPVVDAAKHDFRPKAGSAAIDHGVKVFVPWSLSQEVGAWILRRNNQDPALLLDEHWYPTSYVTDGIDYTRNLLFNLKATNVVAEDFVKSPLEDWTDSALKFNGKDQFLSLSNDEITKPRTYKVKLKKVVEERIVAGGDVASPDIAATNLLIEAYFKTEPKLASSVLVSKMSGSGYQLSINKAGGVTLTLSAAGAKSELASGACVNDGKWHHVIVEADRHAKTGTIYTDGVRVATCPLDLDEKASLSNAGDLLVGKNADGHFFSGTLEYLRIARGTLADAQTSIEELYDWEFDGPFLRDFTGHEPTGAARDAGAYEFVEKN